MPNDIEAILRTAGVTGYGVLIGEPPHTTLGGTVSGADAIAIWRRLRQTLPPIGYWPVLLGDSESLDRLRDGWFAPPTEEIEKAASIEVATWIRARAESDPEYYERVRGKWPLFSKRSTSFAIPSGTSASRSPLPEVYLAAVPTARSWEVPAYLSFGGWNECPLPHEHVAMFSYWFQRYGAEIVGVSSDIIECTVSKPPRTREDALALADEQFIFCADIVSQGTETIENLAATLVGAEVWYFWWD